MKTTKFNPSHIKNYSGPANTSVTKQNTASTLEKSKVPAANIKILEIVKTLFSKMFLTGVRGQRPGVCPLSSPADTLFTQNNLGNKDTGDNYKSNQVGNMSRINHEKSSEYKRQSFIYSQTLEHKSLKT